MQQGVLLVLCHMKSLFYLQVRDSCIISNTSMKSYIQYKVVTPSNTSFFHRNSVASCWLPCFNLTHEAYKNSYYTLLISLACIVHVIWRATSLSSTLLLWLEALEAPWPLQCSSNPLESPALSWTFLSQSRWVLLPCFCSASALFPTLHVGAAAWDQQFLLTRSFKTPSCLRSSPRSSKAVTFSELFQPYYLLLLCSRPTVPVAIQTFSHVSPAAWWALHWLAYCLTFSQPPLKRQFWAFQLIEPGAVLK